MAKSDKQKKNRWHYRKPQRERSRNGADPRTRECPGYDPQLFRLAFTLPENEYLPDWNEISCLIGSMDDTETDKSCPDTDFCFENVSTGAIAFFRGYKPERDGDFGLVMEVPLPHARCLAYEVFPLAVKIARHFSLQIKYCRPDGSWEPLKGEIEDIMEAWQPQNEASWDAKYEGGEPLRIKASSLEAVWEFSLLRDTLERRYEREGCAVLEVEYLKRRKTGEILRACAWNAQEPAVFPPVDIVRLDHPPKPLRDGKLYDAETFFKALKPWIKNISAPISHKLFIKHDDLLEMLEKAAALKGTLLRSYEEVSGKDLKDID